VQLRNHFVAGKEGGLLEEERCSVKPVGSAVEVEAAVNLVGAEAVLMSMCAPLVEPCCASYMEVLTRISESVSGAGVGKALPMAR